MRWRDYSRIDSGGTYSKWHVLLLDPIKNIHIQPPIFLIHIGEEENGVAKMYTKDGETWLPKRVAQSMHVSKNISLNLKNPSDLRYPNGINFIHIRCAHN